MSGRTFYRYSSAFKQKVVSEIESGSLSIAEARSLYDIRGSDTIQSWLRRMGRPESLNQVVRVRMKNETDRIKQLEAEKKELESALAQSQVKILYLDSLIEVIEEEYGIDVKKRHAEKKGSKKPRRGRKRKR